MSKKKYLVVFTRTRTREIDDSIPHECSDVSTHVFQTDAVIPASNLGDFMEGLRSCGYVEVEKGTFWRILDAYDGCKECKEETRERIEIKPFKRKKMQRITFLNVPEKCWKKISPGYYRYCYEEEEDVE